MRHILAPGPVAACSLGMREPSPPAGLVAPPASRLVRRRARAAQSPAQ